MTYQQRKAILYSKLHITKCRICGYKMTKLLDLHHILPHEKLEKVTTFIFRNQMREAEEECHKCIPLCSRCHKEADAGFWNPSFLYHIALMGEE